LPLALDKQVKICYNETEEDICPDEPQRNAPPCAVCPLSALSGRKRNDFAFGNDVGFAK
jgi:hypothetical protein